MSFWMMLSFRASAVKLDLMTGRDTCLSNAFTPVQVLSSRAELSPVAEVYAAEAELTASSEMPRVLGAKVTARRNFLGEA